MLDFEGSRNEFLNLLAEMGEEPAFVARARAPELALDGLLQSCLAKRDELLRWPQFHFSILASRVQRDWSRLSRWMKGSDAVRRLENLDAELSLPQSPRPSWIVRDRSALQRFVESGTRFNIHWQDFLECLDLEAVNRPRHDFNRYYVIEKACAFGSERFCQDFIPLDMIDHPFLIRRFPPLQLPELA
ncbi:hypothetical protein FYK55_06785 [Roseiconus nitratireducens]|uniref:Uncharacterized protein n=1 Tax=Roseiconus nitratireducens TaxID=2605748 RepID=A0A5M6DD71_9BACT|nr:hypothetical protein [Roseiconus nitratireducens]KAA5545353.1 hypothetical protein FYK55_06785 [Roseiconus nitratireducens]